MIFLFDVDSTLTPSRKLMDKTFKKFFLEFMKNNDVRLVTGSNIEKTIEQVGTDIVNNLVVYACSGNQTFINGVLTHENDWKLPENVREWLTTKLNESSFSLRTGNHIEERPGMVNFSIVGRNATHEERSFYVSHDKKHQERLKLAKEFNKTFTNLEARVGGETGLDISPKGCDKSQVLRLCPSEVVFFGDAMDVDGNDYPLKKEIEDKKQGMSYHVVSWEETFIILRDKYMNVKEISYKGVS